ncbi:MAG: efflux RND transporter periplasmic adaptor subunit [Patescibacteria group bacterium]
MNISFIPKLSRKTLIIAGIIILVLVLAGVAIARSGKDETFSVVPVERGNITDSITVTGKVAPFAKADLGFEKTGMVAGVYVMVGDKIAAGKTLAGLESGEQYAQYLAAQADARAERARLLELENGLRKEEVGVESAKIVSARVAVSDALREAENALNNAILDSDRAFKLYFDTLFEGSQPSTLKIDIPVESQKIEREINMQRAEIFYVFRNWNEQVRTGLSSETALSALRVTRANLEEVRLFLEMLEKAVYRLTTTNSGLSTARITEARTAYVNGAALINSASESLTAAEGDLLAASSALQLAQQEFNLREAGSSNEDVAAQTAAYERAQADVQNSSSMLSKATIVSPIAGIVTKVDVEAGEIVTAGTSAVSVMSDDPFKIEVFIPEVDIAKVAIGNKANISLDAYDESIVFSSTVTQIDPAETIVEGIPTYKVTLRFDSIDPRIKSGMTANIRIVTGEKSSVLKVPSRAVKDGKVTVVLDEEGKETEPREVKTGLKGDDGSIEIVSGLNEGERITVSK